MVKASGRHTAGGTFAIPHSIVNSANARRDEQTLMVAWWFGCCCGELAWVVALEGLSCTTMRVGCHDLRRAPPQRTLKPNAKVQGLLCELPLGDDLM